MDAKASPVVPDDWVLIAPLTFDLHETETVWEGGDTKNNRRKLKNLVERKVVGVTLSHYHGVTGGVPEKNGGLRVEYFVSAKPHRQLKFVRYDLLTLRYRYARTTWRQVYRYVRGPKGGMDGMLYFHSRKTIALKQKRS